MLDAAPPPKRKASRSREITPDEAREKIVAKLGKAGSKGALALLPAKAGAIYKAALAELEKEELVFVDRRKAKPRFYLWEARPAIPTPSSVAEELCRLVATQFPQLCAIGDLKKQLGKAREKVALLPAALEYAVERTELAALRHRTGKKEAVLYTSTAAFRAAFPEAGGTAQAAKEGVELAYHALVQRSGFPAVAIAALQEATGLPLESLQEWLRAGHRSGRVVLSLGDWSLATPAQQAAAIELGGERYLQARLLE